MPHKPTEQSNLTPAPSCSLQGGAGDSFNTNPPAFPTAIKRCRMIRQESGDLESVFESGDTGMTLRDYFAANALQGWIAQWSHPSINQDSVPKYNTVAEHAYKFADAMLAERQKEANQ